MATNTKAASCGNLRLAQAHWVTRDTVAWKLEGIPTDAAFQLHYSFGAELTATATGVQGGQVLSLSYDSASLCEEIVAEFPHLKRYQALKLDVASLEVIPEVLKGQLAVTAVGYDGTLLDATSLQIPGVLDDLYTYDGPLGVTYYDEVPTLRVWAPTARLVTLHLFDDSNPGTSSTIFPMSFDPNTGVWEVRGIPDWTLKYYLYEVEVFARSTGRIERNLVTDPYSISLSTNSQRSQIVNLDDPSLKPAGWDELQKSFLVGLEDIIIYELHLRDFSIFDETVPEPYRGTFMAFTKTKSNGMCHLRHLAEASLTHVHLLPVFDIATINEDKVDRLAPDHRILARYGPDSAKQQALIALTRDCDGYNWGYDPYHYAVPEGSYSTDPDGPARILEFRSMVQALNKAGLRVIMDVVYNHTYASDQDEKSVLDKIVPGYYHRLNQNGEVETSTCCPNTATEHAMMEKLMIDTLLIWATAYKVDGFRFDLMGHHMVDNMIKVRDTLHGLTIADDGVDGSSIYIYGEGWDFGEVADNARGVNATQLNLYGTRIGTFNDRMRDAVRGDRPFIGRQEQGFITGLYYDPNEVTPLSKAEQLAQLLWYADLIRLGLAGNLSDYAFVDRRGETVTGASVDYGGYPAGYTQAPQEQIVYVSAHDNETLFDSIQYKIPLSASVSDRVRIQNMGLSLVALAQGIPFFHAGSDMLRSKSLDRDSHKSGDWFNRLDFTYSCNNWGVGLPPAESNADDYPLIRPLLRLTDIRPGRENILKTVAHFREMLRIRKSSPLFRLKTAAEVHRRLHFHNTGPNQIPGLIVMSLDDTAEQTLDPNYDRVVVLFNASNKAHSFTIPQLVGTFLTLHPVQAESHDPVVREATYSCGTGTFTVPARTTSVFVQPPGASCV